MHLPSMKQLLRQIRRYHVLAIESSCDDSCVALLERTRGETRIVDNMKKTLNSTAAGGVIPTSAQLHHQQNIAPLVAEMCRKHRFSPPELVAVTRGPGMVGSLSVGYDVAKGLSIAWGSKFIGVHHMLGHLLVSRMFDGLPQYPFVSLLVSGGHTMVVLSYSVLRHEILANTIDIAAGDALDKCAREIGIRGEMIGKQLELFLQQGDKAEGISFTMPTPLENKPGRKDICAFSFSSFVTGVKQSLARHGDVDDPTRRAMGDIIQEAIFTHITRKVCLALDQNKHKLAGVSSFVCSGGVGSNLRLRSMLEAEVSKKFSIEKFHFPDPSLCTDNAVMIGWAAIEVYESHGVTTGLDTSPIRKWPLQGWSESGIEGGLE